MMPPKVPVHTSAIYKAADLIYRAGSKTDDELLTAIDFGSKTAPTRKHKLTKAVADGWLVRLPDGRFGLSSFAIAHLDAHQPAAPTPKYQGIPAAPRQIDVMHRPPLSRRYLLNPRGSRMDVPPWSVRGDAAGD